MNPWWIAVAVPLLAVSGLPALVLRRGSAAGAWLATVLNVAGSALGLAGIVAAWRAPGAIEMRLPFDLPFGPTFIGVDAISTVFLAPIFLISGLGAIYGMGYWKPADHPETAGRLRLFWGIETAALATQVIARDSVLFLIAWEIMALAAFFLVTTEDREPGVRRAGYVYIVSTHLGTLFLLIMFTVLRQATGSFALWPSSADGLAPATAALVFSLGVLGFGLKAGVMPLHVWLPGAHASAPSHVSALMSGVLIKTGVYGLVRLGALLSHPPAWFGATLLALGTLSAVLGIAFAVAQRDLKRMLAYSSIENVGIIVAALGLALIGRTADRADWVALGLGGALLHVWNHGLFKPLLFFGAGSIVHATGTREVDRLGGLARPMPLTFAAMTVGAVAICGLPPLNGFISEIAVYLGLFHTVAGGAPSGFAPAALAAPLLAMVGALAVLCFVKLIGTVFLGTPRTLLTPPPHEAPRAMRFALLTLAAACVMVGLAPMLVVPLIDPAVRQWAEGTDLVTSSLESLVPFTKIAAVGGAVVAGVLLLTAAIRVLMRGRILRRAGTWDCGFLKPTARIQYTGSSFSQMIVKLLASVLRPNEEAPEVRGIFAEPASFTTDTPDAVLDRGVTPFLRLVGGLLSWSRLLQGGRVQVYLLYVVVTLVVLLFVA